MSMSDPNRYYKGDDECTDYVLGLESRLSDVAAGCDIQRADGSLYRQVRVVIGPGKTADQLEVERLRGMVTRALAACKSSWWPETIVTKVRGILEE